MRILQRNHSRFLKNRYLKILSVIGISGHTENAWGETEGDTLVCLFSGSSSLRTTIASRRQKFAEMALQVLRISSLATISLSTVIIQATISAALGDPRRSQSEYRIDSCLFSAGVGVEVAGGGFKVGAAEEFLDGADVNSVADEIGCEGVAESMGVMPLSANTTVQSPELVDHLAAVWIASKPAVDKVYSAGPTGGLAS